jgi:hypothetical protein
MKTIFDIQGSSGKHGWAIAAATVLLALSSATSSAQFRAVTEAGETTILDAGGQEVSVAPADPVGTRPMDCPATAFYVSEVPNDKTELVLTDCATGLSQYTVEMVAPTE